MSCRSFQREGQRERYKKPWISHSMLSIDPNFYGLAHLKGLIVLLLLRQSDPLGGNSPAYIAKAER